MKSQPFSQGPLQDALASCRPMLLWAAGFSALVNILYLTPTIYMMQVYDRAVPSGSGGTLVLLSLVALVGFMTLSALDWLRGRLLTRVSARFDRLLAGPTLNAALSGAALSRLERAEAMREFDTLRQTIAGAAMLAVFDLPWAPIYLLVTFLLHPLLGLMTLAAALVLILLARANERATHAPMEAANAAAAGAYAKQAQISAYADEVRAIGMREALTAKSLDDRSETNRLQLCASFAAGRYGALIKFFRIIFQSGALAVGAWLAVTGQISMGSIIAASLLLSRALTPIEQVVGSWKGLLRARIAYQHLTRLLDGVRVESYIQLPPLAGRIEVEGLSVRAAGSAREILSSINFAIAPGEAIGIAGLSGAGKSTVLRALAGALMPATGIIRFDGAASADWEPGRLGRSLGYLPQDFVLFPGSIRDNISRFDIWRGAPADEVDAATIAAARAIGAHDTILRLPRGYDTPVGHGGGGLSAGQTQRIAIARALYREPRIVLLDEPNAHLDADAAANLFEALARLKRDGVTVVMAAHSGEFLATCDRLLVLGGGRLAERPVSALQPVRSLNAQKA